MASCLPEIEMQIVPRGRRREEKQLFIYFQNADASYDFSSNDHFPYPRYTDTWFNRYAFEL